MGISDKEKRLDFIQSMVCSTCGSYGSYKAFMTYSYFNLFFIPIIKFVKKYYITTTCCGTVYEISKELGKKIERGENVTINESDLQPLNVHKEKTCYNCGSPMEENYEFCPKCGRKTF